jgi:UDP-glucuronate decarboxylase
VRHRDWEIVGVDNLWTGVRRPLEYVSHMVESDIETYMSEPFDYIYHLASPASPRHYQSDPLRTVRANVVGLLRCLKMMHACSVLLMGSTSEVYGDPQVVPQPERYRGSVDTQGIRACYDESKRLCETICADWHRTGLGSVKIARIFNTYGPGMQEGDGRVVSNMVCQMIRGEPLTIYGSGHQTRCFCYVDNTIWGLVRLAEETPTRFTGPVNIGGDNEIDICTLASLVLVEGAHLGIVGPREVEYMAPARDDPQRRVPDLNLAKSALGWQTQVLVPLVGEGGGLQKTIQYFQDLLSNSR